MLIPPPNGSCAHTHHTHVLHTDPIQRRLLITDKPPPAPLAPILAILLICRPPSRCYNITQRPTFPDTCSRTAFCDSLQVDWNAPVSIFSTFAINHVIWLPKLWTSH